MHTSTISTYRINNNAYGSPRTVIHFLELVTEAERIEAEKIADERTKQGNITFAVSVMYEIALRKAKTIDGKKFRNKQFGGGIVFNDDEQGTIERITSLLNNQQTNKKQNNNMNNTQFNAEFLSQLGTADFESWLLVQQAYRKECWNEEIMQCGFNTNSGYIYIALENGICIASHFGRPVVYIITDYETGEEHFSDSYDEAINKQEELNK